MQFSTLYVDTISVVELLAKKYILLYSEGHELLFVRDEYDVVGVFE